MMGKFAIDKYCIQHAITKTVNSLIMSDSDNCNGDVKTTYNIIVIKNKIDCSEIDILYVYKLSFIKSHYT